MGPPSPDGPQLRYQSLSYEWDDDDTDFDPNLIAFVEDFLIEAGRRLVIRRPTLFGGPLVLPRSAGFAWFDVEAEIPDEIEGVAAEGVVDGGPVAEDIIVEDGVTDEEV